MKNVLIVGAGSIGERHLRCFQATGRAQVGFVEVRKELGDQIAGRYPKATRFSSLQEALGQKWDGTVIATPAPLHLSQALEIVRQGTGVLIEKPLSVGMEGVAPLLTAVREQGTPAAVAYVYRAHPALAEMRAVLQSEKLGRPVELVATCGQNFPTYRPAYRDTYYAQRESGGGAVQDALTHVLNAGEWLIGGIERVVADLAHQVLSGVDVEDTAHVLARHQGGIPAVYSLNQHQAPNEITLTVVCERGTARFEYHACRWRMMEAPETPWIDSAPVTLERDTLFIRQADAFLDTLEGTAAPLCSLEEGVNTLRVNLAVLKSAETGSWCRTGSEMAAETLASEAVTSSGG